MENTWCIDTYSGAIYIDGRFIHVCQGWTEKFGVNHRLQVGDKMSLTPRDDSTVSISHNDNRVQNVFQQLPDEPLWLVWEMNIPEMKVVQRCYEQEKSPTKSDHNRSGKLSKKTSLILLKITTIIVKAYVFVFLYLDKLYTFMYMYLTMCSHSDFQLGSTIQLKVMFVSQLSGRILIGCTHLLK